MKSLWCDHLNKMNVLSCGTVFYYTIQSESVDKSYGVTIQMKLRYWSILSCGTVYYAVKGDSKFCVCEQNPMV